MSEKPLRILWLLNHTTLRRFELEQFGALGITEIFCPKRFPYDEGNLSASVDASLDAGLSIPASDLAVLNRQDWYGSPDGEAWRLANRHFAVAVIGFFPQQIASCARNFLGAIVLRVFGLAKGHSYSRILADELGAAFMEKIGGLGGRFWFAAGYAHLQDEEGELFQKRNCHLPVGLAGKYEPQAWTGGDKRIFFVCPRIETSPYFNAIYRAFVEDFAGLGYLVGGAQPIKVNDPQVLGFVPAATHARNMREMRVMFYHGSEPNHVHYHPFEAIRCGMPLVFMAGGLLDRFGGSALPGRCTSVREARRKIERILGGDRALIDSIRSSQECLLAPMLPENCGPVWRAGFQRILAGLARAEAVSPAPARRKTRIAVILPIGYRGGSLRGAKLLAQAIETGSRQAGEAAEVVFAHLDDAACYPEQVFSDLPASIRRRPYRWRTVERGEARRALAYAGREGPAEAPIYQVPDDGIRHFTDCDLWIVVSDRLEYPLLPVRPYVLMVYDYLQRYESLLPPAATQQFAKVAHAAERIFVTTEFTRRDAVQFAGLPARRVGKLPMLAPAFAAGRAADAARTAPYFLWTTNLAAHKNHEKALAALRLYYEKYEGTLACCITGVDSAGLLAGDSPHFQSVRAIYGASPALQRQLKAAGELPDAAYRARLAGAAFLWHAGRIDNGTFSVIEAAQLGVPSLSSDYPAMREIAAQFALNLTWMDAHRPDDMAQQLKFMEGNARDLRAGLPSQARLASQSVERLAGAYWEAVRACL